MPKQPPGRVAGDTELEDGHFLRRWSRRKLQASEEQQPAPQPSPPQGQTGGEAAEGAEPALTDADMPPLESITEDSDVSGFLSPQVSEELRRLALRRLFKMSKFNVVDGLDDYDDDFTTFAALGDIVTTDMRFERERQAEEAALDEVAGPEREAPLEEAVADESPREEQSGEGTHVAEARDKTGQADAGGEGDKAVSSAEAATGVGRA